MPRRRGSGCGSGSASRRKFLNICTFEADRANFGARPQIAHTGAHFAAAQRLQRSEIGIPAPRALNQLG